MKQTKGEEDNVIKNAQTALTIVNQANNPMILLDQKGNIIWFNNGFAELHDYSYDEFSKDISSKYSEFVSVLEGIECSFFEKHSSKNYTRTFLTKNNVRKWVQSSLTPIKNSENIVEKYIVVETDITYQKEIEEELVQRWENTQTLAEHLEAVKSYTEEQVNDLNEEKRVLKASNKKSEDILKRLLPIEVATQLKKKGYSRPRKYKKVTSILIKINNFDDLSSKTLTEDLIIQMHESISAFDSILEKHYIEKIKTYRDSYLGVGGVPLHNRSNAFDVSISALQVKQTLYEINAFRKKNNMIPFEISIGIHTGRLIAGIIGKNKLTYDVWGEAINVSHYIGNNASANSIWLSESTYNEIAEFFDCIKVDIHVGKHCVYELKRIKPELSFDDEGIFPNSVFMNVLSKL